MMKPHGAVDFCLQQQRMNTDRRMRSPARRDAASQRRANHRQPTACVSQRYLRVGNQGIRNQKSTGQIQMAHLAIQADWAERNDA